MKEGRQALAKAIKEKALVRGRVELSNAGSSNTYFDLKGLLGEGRYLRSAAHEMLAEMREHWPQASHVGGLETGAVFITAGIVYHSSCTEEKPLQGCIVRKSERKHGLGSRIENNPGAGKPGSGHR